MRTIGRLCVLLALIFSSALFAEDLGSQTAIHPAIAKLKALLEPLIKNTYPDANVQFQNSEMSATFATQKFMVHTILKTGEIDPKAYESTGPGFKGFMLEISIHNGEYNGAARVPQTVNEPYWATFLNVYPLASHEYIWLGLSYGAGVPNEFIEKLKKAAEDATKNN